jgi:hypothetical protein
MFPLPPINHNITTTYILWYKDTLPLKYLQIMELKKYGVLRRRALSLAKKMVATMSRNRLSMQSKIIKHTSKGVHLLTFLKRKGEGQGGSVVFSMCSLKMFLNPKPYVGESGGSTPSSNRNCYLGCLPSFNFVLG